MPREIIVAPSLLSADASRFGEEIISVRDEGAKWLHFDIMDGHFVPNISYGPHLLKCLNNYGMLNDVHLMLEDPVKYASKFVVAGADLICFHYEAVKDPLEAQQQIRELKKGLKVGLAICPRTSVKEILPYVNYFDMILIMSVEPGFGGQAFIPSALEDIKILRKYIDDNHLSTLIEVDGGINEETAPLCKEAGADILVTGSYLFGCKNRKKAMAFLLRGEE